MTKSNETSQGDLVRARRRGNLALWISVLSGAVSIVVLTVVLLAVYNTEKSYTVREQRAAGLEAEIVRLGNKKNVLSDEIEKLDRQRDDARAKAEKATAAAAGVLLLRVSEPAGRSARNGYRKSGSARPF